jgi:hypothetical protein
MKPEDLDTLQDWVNAEREMGAKMVAARRDPTKVKEALDAFGEACRCGGLVFDMLKRVFGVQV